ncbi:methionine ABC transporter permease, partial [Acinetobacter baumannii]|nr:methionine ABC transporter permease [Acinetobacter baumannii]
AISYGYQRFDTSVVILTVIVLLLLVQIVQMLGNWLAKMR